jgi:DNA-binding PadR family transcriptional regulator
MTKPEFAFATFPLDYLALGLLMPGPRHGYQLYQEYLRAFGPVWAVGRSKFYATLSRLEEAGHLRSTTELQPDRPPRKVLHLADSGRDLFLEWVYQPVTPMRGVRVEFLAKLRFFSLLGLPDPDRLIDAQIAVCDSALAGWQRKAEQERASGSDPFFQRLYDFRCRQARFLIEWLHACKQPVLSVPETRA